MIACRWMPSPGAGAVNGGKSFERDRRASRGQAATRYLYSCIVDPEGIDSVFDRSLPGGRVQLVQPID
jgi:hypothetical protein